MNKKQFFFLIILVVIAALTGILLYSNPLRRPDARVRAWLFKHTPLKSSLSEVELEAAKRGWILQQSRERGNDGPYTFGGTYVRGEIGSYQGFPLQTGVTAFWEFDASNQLTNIRIWKTRDGL